MVMETHTHNFALFESCTAIVILRLVLIYLVHHVPARLRPRSRCLLSQLLMCLPSIISHLSLSLQMLAVSKTHGGCKLQNFAQLSELKKQLGALQSYKRIATKHAKQTPLVLSETAGASGGCPGLTNAFAGTLWYLFWLGSVGEQGFRMLYRQDLVSADAYALINVNMTTHIYMITHLNPDYYLSILWRRLMDRDG